ncbi:hypothetical protein CSAL01_12488 [Colletotrichum salicis]|uniref:Hydroxyneurosporene synthase n=1 Tax=Colletotrichum salicis TaxID=1209931 RepID=A0A135TMK9_9PEZI|nr:hypothetical protein CSAL01_12488 [Colletotrichum salicis]
MALYTMALTTLLLRPTLGYTLNLMPSFNNYTFPVEHISLPGNLDGAKANSSVNASTSDFWYFDTQPGVVGPSTAVEVVFFNFPDLGTSQPLVVQVTGAFSNGTRFHKNVEATDGATITNDENGVRGEWKGVDATFLGTPLDKPNVTYTITIDSDEIELVPYLYWANAVPDAAADVDITIDGERISFVNGVGYHDKNWADKSIIKSHKFWDWGHAQFGPYSVVWFVVTEKDNSTHPYTYVAKDGEPVHVACGAGFVNVQQWGGLAANPPSTGLNDVDGLIVTFGLEDSQTLVANVTKTAIVLDEVVHQRANGVVSGRILDSDLTYDGFADFEEYIIGFIDVEVSRSEYGGIRIA